jgi:hypothetical protein
LASLPGLFLCQRLKALASMPGFFHAKHLSTFQRAIFNADASRFAIYSSRSTFSRNSANWNQTSASMSHVRLSASLWSFLAMRKQATARSRSWLMSIIGGFCPEDANEWISAAT